VKDSCPILVVIIPALAIIFQEVPNIFILHQEIANYPQMFTILVKTVSSMENGILYVLVTIIKNETQSQS
jgi:hypothetical protein